MKKNPFWKSLLALAGLLMLGTGSGRRSLQVTDASAAESKTPATEARAARDDIGKTLGFVPGFFRAMSDSAVAGAWQEMKGLQLNPRTALPGRTKELIGLAVSSQIPCRYCIYAHTAFAELNGASDSEIAEAIALAGAERHWSAYFYGAEVDENKFRAEVQRLVQNAKTPAAPQQSIVVIDARTALADIQQTLGFVPEFLRSVSEPALPGAWREMKDLKFSQSTSLSAKNKALIGLAVASQVPSKPCIVAETAFARLGGASDAEIAEAIGMAALTRNLSTMLNGQQTDEPAFRAEIDRLIAGVKASQHKSASAASNAAH